LLAAVVPDLRRAARSGAALLALAVLLGCSGVPSEGDPVGVRQVPPAALDDPDIRTIAVGPRPGQTPTEVVAGFLAASDSSDRRHVVARAYLTAAASRSWDDTVGVNVLASLPTVKISADSSSARLTAPRRGVVGPDGVYTARTGQLSVDLRMRQVGDQWRIDALPDGILLPESDFSSYFKTVDLYFLNPDQQILIPDRRHLAVRRSALPSAMVSALLGGPSPWLAPAVRTAFPPGTRLGSNVVENDGVLVVELAETLAGVPAASRAALSAQLVWTLRQLPVTGVRLLAAGGPVDVPGVGEVQQRQDWASYDPAGLPGSASAYYLHRGAVRPLIGTPDSSPVIAEPIGARSAALAPDLSRLAIVRATAAGDELLEGPAGEVPTRRLRAADLGVPTFGSGDRGVYVVRNSAEVVLVPPIGPARVIASPELAKLGRVTGLRVARDGTRAAVVAGQEQADQQVYLGRLYETPAGLVLDGLRPLAPGLRSVAGVAWADASSLAVLGRALDPAEPAPWLVQVDGQSLTSLSDTNLPRPLLSLAAAPARPVLVRVGSSTAPIWRRTGGGWGPALPGSVQLGDAPFYPG